MATEKLSDRQVKALKPGMSKKTGKRIARLYNDGGGLNLQVTPGEANGSVSKSWLFRYVSPVTGKERRMGLGSYPDVSLAVARQKAAEARQLLAQGIDPIESKRDARASRTVASVKAMTFDQCRDAYKAAHQAEWSLRYAKDWVSSVTRYASPTFGRLPPSMIDVTLAMRALEPIWSAMPVLAPLVRERCESVWSWARARGYCTGENPFRWDNLKHLLASPSKIHTVQHFAALPYVELPSFMTKVRARSGTAARAFEFTVLTVARTNEVLGARWDEIDSEAGTWTVPPKRAKNREEHRIPLSPSAMSILEQQAKVRENDYVFPGNSRHRLSHAAMDALLTRMGRSDITVHGTARSGFKDWCAETTNYPDWVSEKALAHKVGDETRRAYQRGDLLDRRRKLMEMWAEYLIAPADASHKVVPLRSTA